MTKLVAEIEQKIRSLKPKEKTELLRSLIAELDGGSDANVERAWLDVAKRRQREIVEGRVKTIPAEQVFKNLQTALAAAGATFKDVVKMNTYTTDMSQVQPIRDVRARYFGDTVPASTLVQVVRLARPEFMLEIEVIAVVAQ